nr:hypothetical transcript [Hymenolepis microstoma]
MRKPSPLESSYLFQLGELMLSRDTTGTPKVKARVPLTMNQCSGATEFLIVPIFCIQPQNGIIRVTLNFGRNVISVGVW